MVIKPLSIDGTWLFQPQLFDDARGTFAAWHQRDVFQEATVDLRVGSPTFGRWAVVVAPTVAGAQEAGLLPVYQP